MQKLILTVGIPGSGKDYYYKKVCQEDSTLVRVTKDEIRKQMRKELGKDDYARVNENEVIRRENEFVVTNLKAGKNVVSTNTHLNPMHINERFPKLLQDNDLADKVEIVVDKQFLDVPIAECIRRDALREGVDRVGESVIRKMAQQMYEYGWK